MSFFSRRPSKAKLDVNAQPPASIGGMRRIDRDVAEMLGLAKGMLADGVVSEEEAWLLRDWCKGHPDAISVWPGNVLKQRLDKIFRDRVVDDEERLDLAGLLSDIVGGKAGVLAGATAASTLPLDKPAPKIKFPHKTFVFTGRFAFGPRKVCQEAVSDLGGYCETNVTLRTNVLVLGTFGSTHWIQSSHGRKIEKALEYRDKRKTGLVIVGEDHWAAAVG